MIFKVLKIPSVQYSQTQGMINHSERHDITHLGDVINHSDRHDITHLGDVINHSDRHDITLIDMISLILVM